MRPVREITADEENFRLEIPEGSPPNVKHIRRDPVEPEPVGTFIALVFKITGYDRDCDGSLMPRLEQVNLRGSVSGMHLSYTGLYSDSGWVLDSADELQRISDSGS